MSTDARWTHHCKILGTFSLEHKNRCAQCGARNPALVAERRTRERLIEAAPELLRLCELALADEDRGFMLKPETADLMREAVRVTKMGRA